MAIQPPNYTQTPNEIYDLLRDMSESEMRVTLAICRATFGWHQPKSKLSLTDLEGMTGLSRQGVVDGVSAGMERGTIAREVDGNGFCYWIVVDAPSQHSGLVNTVDQSTKLTRGSQHSRPEVVNTVDQPLKGTKKTTKKIKETTTTTVNDPPPPDVVVVVESPSKPKNKPEQTRTYRLLREHTPPIGAAREFANEDYDLVKAYLDRSDADGMHPAQIVENLRAGLHRTPAPIAAPNHQSQHPPADDPLRPIWISPRDWANLTDPQRDVLQGATVVDGKIVAQREKWTQTIYTRWWPMANRLVAAAEKQETIV